MSTSKLSSPKQALIVAKFELLKHLKSKRFLATVILLPPITILLYLSVFDPGITVLEFAEDYLLPASQIVIVLGLFFGVDAISSEFEEKTGYVTLSNPIGRGWTTAGKFLAGAVIVSILVGIVFIAGIVYMMWNYGAIAVGFAPAFLYALLLGCAALGTSLFLSAALPGNITPWVFGYFLFLFIMPVIEVYLRLETHIEPLFLLTFTGRALPAFIQYPQRVYHGAGGPIYNYPDFAVGVIVMMVYLLIGLALAVYFFKRREMR
jgi:ABC-type transport system involved in multi-copper enzyme maturation permease subunit